MYYLRSAALGFLLAAVVALAACGGDVKPAAPSSTSTPPATAAPTTAAAPAGQDSFRAFAPQIESAITSGDVQFFVSRAVIQEWTCTEQYGSCADKPVGTVLTGIPYGLWATEAGQPLPPQDFSDILGSFLGQARTDLSDEYGSGAPSLYALAEVGSGARLMSAYGPGQQMFMALASAVVPLSQGLRPERRVNVLLFAQQDSEWAFMGAISSGGLYSQWLSGSCGDCYDYWERWQASASH